LMARAKFVLRAGNWYEQFETVPNYTWVNSHEIVYRLSDTAHPRPDQRWFVMDVRTQKARPINHLGDKSYLFDSMSDPTPNPAGSKLLWEAADSKFKPLWVVTDLDGRTIGSWTRHAVRFIASAMGQDQSWAEWSLDGRAIFECESKAEKGLALHVWRRDISNLSKEIVYPTLEVISKPEDRYVIYDLGNGEAAWIEGPMFTISGRQLIRRWRLDRPAKAKTSSFIVPAGMMNWSPIVSPDHTRILWECWSSGLFVSLWVSKMDGYGLHELGAVRLDPKLKANGVPGFGEVHWIPGRAAASFCFMRKIYEVSVGIG